MCSGHPEQSPSLPQRLVLGLLAVYRRLLSPLLGPRCRFHPTCSAYATTAVMRFGVLRGGVLAVFRVLRCQPLFEGGIDPVPATFPSRPWRRTPAPPPAEDEP